MYQSFQGIVLFLQPHKEYDAIVKIFTLEYGKQMFFVRGFYKGIHTLKSVLLPFTRSEFIGQINRNGLSFLSEYKSVKRLMNVYDDLYAQTYAAYIAGLADAVIDDRQVSEPIYRLLYTAYELIDQKRDISMVTLLFELKLMLYFGVALNWQECILTGKKQGPFDFSLKYGGLLAQSEWEKDKFRMKADPNALFLLQKMNSLPFEKVGSIQVSEEMKKELRRIMDALYGEYVGIHLKSKQFLDDMEKWYT